jgi:hypothetical protein
LELDLEAWTGVCWVEKSTVGSWNCAGKDTGLRKHGPRRHGSEANVTRATGESRGKWGCRGDRGKIVEGVWSKKGQAGLSTLDSAASCCQRGLSALESSCAQSKPHRANSTHSWQHSPMVLVPKAEELWSISALHQLLQTRDSPDSLSCTSPRTHIIHKPVWTPPCFSTFLRSFTQINLLTKEYMRLQSNKVTASPEFYRLGIKKGQKGWRQKMTGVTYNHQDNQVITLSRVAHVPLSSQSMPWADKANLLPHRAFSRASVHKSQSAILKGSLAPIAKIRK